MAQPKEQHFLVVSFSGQGHINPSLQLAKRLTLLGARVTFSTGADAHRLGKMADGAHLPPLLTCSPYSVGKYDSSLLSDISDERDYVREVKSVGSRTLAELAGHLADAGRPVTCIIYNFLVPWAAAVARDLGVPSALLWIQPAAVFGIYYLYFHGYADLIEESNTQDPFSPLHLPGLPAFRVRDIPSLLRRRSPEDDIYFTVVEELFMSLGTTTRILVNTFEDLELDFLRMADPLELLPIGPALPSAYVDGGDSADTLYGGDLRRPPSTGSYTAWLDSQPDRSVVYVSFGSYAEIPVQYRAEISRALEGGRWSYLWVVRGSREGVEEGERGMVVEWCSQVEVLAHRAVGCFITHCGWNSTLESLTCGVPMIGLPQWTDQSTNSRLAEAVWRIGVRAEVNADGQLEAAELRRCLDLVMGEGEQGEAIRERADAWGRKAREAWNKGGSSDRNLRDFVRQLE